MSSRTRTSRQPYTEQDDKELWNFYIKEFRKRRYYSSNKMWDDFLAQHGKKRLVWSLRRPSGIESHFRRVMLPNIVDSHLRGKDLYDVMKFYQTKLDKTDIKVLENRESVKIVTDDHGCFLKAINTSTNDVINETQFILPRKGSADSEGETDIVIHGSVKRTNTQSDGCSSYRTSTDSEPSDAECSGGETSTPKNTRRMTRSQINTASTSRKSNRTTPKTVENVSTSRIDEPVPSPKKRAKTDHVNTPRKLEKWNENLRDNLRNIIDGKLGISDLDNDVVIPEKYKQYFDIPVAKTFLRLALKGPRDGEAVPMALMYQAPVTPNIDFNSIKMEDP